MSQTLQSIIVGLAIAWALGWIVWRIWFKRPDYCCKKKLPNDPGHTAIGDKYHVPEYDPCDQCPVRKHCDKK